MRDKAPQCSPRNSGAPRCIEGPRQDLDLASCCEILDLDDDTAPAHSLADMGRGHAQHCVQIGCLGKVLLQGFWQRARAARERAQYDSQHGAAQRGTQEFSPLPDKRKHNRFLGAVRLLKSSPEKMMRTNLTLALAVLLVAQSAIAAEDEPHRPPMPDAVPAAGAPASQAAVPTPPPTFEDALAAYERREYKQAFEIWEGLAKLGDARSQYRLGLMYEKGQYVVYDGEQALGWYTRAAESNEPDAQYRLAQALEKGQGLEENPMQAVFWYARAAANGSEAAKKDLQRLQEEIDDVVAKQQIRVLEKVQAQARREGFEEGVTQAKQTAEAVALKRELERKREVRNLERQSAEREQRRQREFKQELEAARKATIAQALRDEEERIRREALVNVRGEVREQIRAEAVAELRGEVRQELQRRARSDSPQTPVRDLLAERRAALDALAERSAKQAKTTEQAITAFDAGRYDEALKILRKLAAGDESVALARYYLGRAYEQGSGVERDAAQARSWYLSVADTDLLDAQVRLADLLSMGDTAVRDDAQAARWYERRAEAGDPYARERLIQLYGPSGPLQNPAEAVRWVRRMAEAGAPDYQRRLGDYYRLGYGVPQDAREAVVWYRQAAEQGNAEAQLRMGEAYAGGDGVARFTPEAARWYREAGRRGVVQAQYLLAQLYDRGDGLPEDVPEAMRWYERAAGNGSTAAQRRLGELYADDGRVARDYVAAARWLRKAAEASDPAAQYRLAKLHLDGQGLPQDYAMAANWLERAARQNWQPAQQELGRIYFSGLGTKPDYVKAHLWWNLAAARGDTLAGNYRDIVARRMSPTQLVEAQRMSREMSAVN
ncbi:MAG: hypothetical protein DWQ09_06475 [Proteobacteria bacterium]|nr:MAG: hypothetical protein DWQ09_06475 [Pseudomonadota bacterium]